MSDDDFKRLWTFVSEALYLNPSDDCSQLELDFSAHVPENSNAERDGMTGS